MKITNKLTTYIDENITFLQEELKQLEEELKLLSAEKQDIIHDINIFNSRYNVELGEIISKILFLKQSILKYKSEKNIEVKDDYDEAKDDYNNFHDSYNYELNNPIDKLNKDEKQELKSMYRKASKMCHPDTVTDEYKTKAENIFKELNEAYSKNKLSLVREILNNLKNNEFNSTSNNLKEKDLLIEKIAIIKEQIVTEKNNIYNLIQSATYIKISSITDNDEYFKIIKIELENECDTLQKQLDEIESI